jgi:hypothetical protein
MTTVIVLNGTSSSGKSSIARALQALLPEPFLSFGTDTLLDALPIAMEGGETGISVSAAGTVSVGPGFPSVGARLVRRPERDRARWRRHHHRRGLPRWWRGATSGPREVVGAGRPLGGGALR